MQVVSLDYETRRNTAFRHVVTTEPGSQLVLMCLLKGEQTDVETHPETDQFIYVVSGDAHFVIGQEKTRFVLSAGQAITVPRGTKHFFENVHKTQLKLYTIYSKPMHAKNAHEERAPQIGLESKW